MTFAVYTPEQIEDNDKQRKSELNASFENYCISDSQIMAQEKKELNESCMNELKEKAKNNSAKRKAELQVLFTNHFKKKREKNTAEFKEYLKRMQTLANEKSNWEKDNSNDNYKAKLSEINNKISEASKRNKNKEVSVLEARRAAIEEEQQQFLSDKELINKIQEVIDKKILLFRKARANNGELTPKESAEYLGYEKVLPVMKSSLKKKISPELYKKYVKEYEDINNGYYDRLYKDTLMNTAKDPDSVINDKSGFFSNDIKEMSKDIERINKKYEKLYNDDKVIAVQKQTEKCKACDELHNKRQSAVKARLDQGILIYKMIDELQSSHKIFNKKDSPEFQKMIKQLRACANVITNPEAQGKKYDASDADNQIEHRCNLAVEACRNYLNLKRDRSKMIGFSDDAKNRIYRTEIILNSLYTYYPETRPEGFTEKDVKANLVRYNNEFRNLNGELLPEGIEVMKHYGAPAANKNQQRIVVDQKTNAINKNTVVRPAAKKQKVPGKH